MLSTVSRSPVAPTVSRLFEAAASAFADKGFHATTTRDIASRAGLSPAGVYVHFTSKEDLLFQLSREGHTVVLEHLEGAVARADSPSSALSDVVETFARWHAEQYKVARIVQYEFVHLTPEHRREVIGLRRRIDALVSQVVADGVASGEFDLGEAADPAITALAVLSMAVDVARWYHPGVAQTPEEIGATYSALALRLVGTR